MRFPRREQSVLSKKAADVAKAVGKDVYVTVYEPIQGLKEFEGRLLSFENEELLISAGKKNM